MLCLLKLMYSEGCKDVKLSPSHWSPEYSVSQLEWKVRYGVCFMRLNSDLCSAYAMTKICVISCCVWAWDTTLMHKVFSPSNWNASISKRYLTKWHVIYIFYLVTCDKYNTWCGMWQLSTMESIKIQLLWKNCDHYFIPWCQLQS